ncbi:tetratricopeptide repeat protein [Thalassoglobus sp. JC818]|uniref:tetratricopeptide repeat protein n=1 Tax=Thalassoglobus sp. JC818 TaxID=3232136 RepID=UPI0034591E34
MNRRYFWVCAIAALSFPLSTNTTFARGFGGGGLGGFHGGGLGGGGFHGGGIGGGGFHGGGLGGGGFHAGGLGGGGGGIHSANFGGGGGFHGGSFGGGGNFGGGNGFSGGGLSGGGFRPNLPSHSPLSGDRPNLNLGGGGGFNNSNLVHRPQTGGFGSGGLGLGTGDRNPLSPGGGITRPDLTPGNRPDIFGGNGRPGLPSGGGTHPNGFHPSNGFGPGSGTASLPGFGPARGGAGGAGNRLPSIHPGEGGAGERLPGMRPGEGGAGTRLPGTRPGEGGAGERLPGTRPGEGGAGTLNPGMRPGQGGAGTRWTPSDRGTIPERHQDLSTRFDQLQNHWGDSAWARQQWVGPHGGEVNHFGFWGPNGYWGHTGVWGPNGGHWGHTGHVGPNGAWGHTGYFGPAGHWSRSWGWYNGYCPVWGHGSWNYLWDEYPVAAAFGATMWGLNVVDYMFGVGDYYNPYYTGPVYVNDQTVVNYSQPIVGNPSYESQESSESDSSDSSSDPLTETFNKARQAFYDEQFDQALKLTNESLSYAPEDAALNEFRSLCLFALGQYQDAAATIHAVLAAGPGWDWTTMISLYDDADVYTKQLRKLEAHVRENPDDAAAMFLLGYHYLTAGHEDAAVAQWKKVIQIKPDDTLTADLVKMYDPPKSDSSSSDQAPAPDLEKPAYPIAQLVGTWTAQDDKGTYVMILDPKDSFTWTFTRDGKPQSVKGAFTVRGKNLVMQPDSGGTMLCKIELTSDKTMQFSSIDDSTKLTFTKP